MVIFCFGLPGSGKSTFIKEKFPGFKHIDIYDFQKDLPFGCSFEQREKQMLAEYEECRQALVAALQEHKDVVLEHTLLKAMRRTPYIEAARSVTDEGIIAYVFNPSLEAMLSMYPKQNPESARAKIEQEKSLLEIPTESDGFAEIHIISEKELPDLSECTYNGNNMQFHVRKEHAKTVTIPANIETLEDSCFYGWSKLENFRVDGDNKHFTEVDGVLFDKTKTILYKYPEGRRESSYTVPDGVTTIKHSAFSDYRDFFARNAYEEDCGKFEVNIPETVTAIEGIVFSSSTRRLAGIHVDKCNQHFASQDGVLYDKNMEKLICCPAGYPQKKFIVPDTVKKIEGDGFDGCINLEHIALPDNLTAIGSHAFEECRNLLDISIPGAVKEMPEFAFAYCYKLTNVMLHEGAQRIDAGAFSMCNFLKNVLIPRSVTEIAGGMAGAFSSPPSMNVHCYEGSYAHSWAQENNISFVLIGDELPDFSGDADAIEGSLRIDSGSLEEKLMGDPEIADLLGKIAGMAGPIIVGGSENK